jgi:hypothetical protein
MSQPPSASQPSNFRLRMLFNQARLNLTGLRDTLQGVSNKEDAREWAEQYGTGLVRGYFFVFELFF